MFVSVVEVFVVVILLKGCLLRIFLFSLRLVFLFELFVVFEVVFVFFFEIIHVLSAVIFFRD